MDSAVRRAIRDSPLGYFPSMHADEYDPDDGLNDVARIDPASALPFEVMSAIFMHIYDAAPLLRRSDQIAHSVACVDRRWRSIALESPGSGRPCHKEMPITVACISRSVDFLEEFMRLVLPHSARWRTLILSCPLVNWLDRISYCPHFESNYLPSLADVS
ncbi:uncharacterized protein SCHCODRAFT_01090961 [Schizophyllum commune H4-8]|nr:uncharacterized protein SCHCODRAFT_01090961 [Schizophyllum commune H4-8]KAI5895982.1 hypothetical protein SCHCODRAFT_01090961 [Schizophyllum commune H4-8]